jgi:benzoyl-CoA reductase/2-hydroxyglutaryl-CoA dehydratase subunit BcrC/BadD/HgdB
MAKRMEEAVRYSKADGFIWGYQFSCRPVAMGSHFVKQWVEEHTEVPTLSLEMDIYDSRNYNSATLRTKVEAFAEMLRARKASVKT